MKKNAFAKLNLFLLVLDKRTDGYHNIYSLFHKIDLADIITISEADELSVVCYGLELEQKENIVYKAATALEKYTSQRIAARIEIEKHIPSGAGLGGGSADAAAALQMLNDFFQFNLSNVELRNIAISLGADVPYFLQDSPALVSGKGEIIEPISFKTNYQYCLLVYPNFTSNTAEAYKLLGRTPQCEASVDLKSFEHYLFVNDFEDVLCAKYSKLDLLRNTMRSISNDHSAMTGSGSAFFALFSSEEQATQANETFIDSGYFSQVVKLI
jgi:4-diphosphocytidyl-2-C-methyl-D-erythritol kinase